MTYKEKIEKLNKEVSKYLLKNCNLSLIRNKGKWVLIDIETNSPKGKFDSKEAGQDYMYYLMEYIKDFKKVNPNKDRLINSNVIIWLN